MQDRCRQLFLPGSLATYTKVRLGGGLLAALGPALDLAAAAATGALLPDASPLLLPGAAGFAQLPLPLEHNHIIQSLDLVSQILKAIRH